MIAILLAGCSSPSRLGYWIDTHPNELPSWQCVEPFTPFKNKEC